MTAGRSRPSSSGSTVQTIERHVPGLVLMERLA